MTGSSALYREWVRLEQPRLGSGVTYANDEFFGARERLIAPTDPVFVPEKYDAHGKWMDGWETRRRRQPGHDYCIIKLGIRGRLHGVEIDTRYFTGNFPSQASIDACVSDEDVPTGDWTEILGKVTLSGDSRHYFDIASDSSWTHVRFNIYPDGGVARLRLYGEIRPDPATLTGVVDLVAVENGGRPIACSDEHFGSMQNLNVPGRGVNMGDGWETARRRGPGHDWVVLALGHPGVVEAVEIDTAYFKGNYPDRVSLEAGLFEHLPAGDMDALAWQMLLPETPLEADKLHRFDEQVLRIGTVNHVRLSIFPDGGVSRVRLYGHVAPERSQ